MSNPKITSVLITTAPATDFYECNVLYTDKTRTSSRTYLSVETTPQKVKDFIAKAKKTTRPTVHGDLMLSYYEKVTT